MIGAIGLPDRVDRARERCGRSFPSPSGERAGVARFQEGLDGFTPWLEDASFIERDAHGSLALTGRLTRGYRARWLRRGRFRQRPFGWRGTMENGQAGTPMVIGSGGSASSGGSSGSQNGASGSESAGGSGAPGAGGSSGGQSGADAAVDARSGAGGSAVGPDAGARDAAASCVSSDPLKTGNAGRDAFDCTLIDLAAKYQHPDPMMLKAQVNQESDFDEFAVSMDSPCGIKAGWTDAESKSFGLIQTTPACGEAKVALLADGHPNLTKDTASALWQNSVFNPASTSIRAR